MSKRSKSKGKQINPTFWVFCEGETEEAYTHYLRTKYRLPIEIVAKKAGSSISDKKIQKSKQGKPTHEKDKDFLMYDGDVRSVLDNLQKIGHATLLISTPSIELWFLYHYKDQKAEISEDECIKELEKRNKTYKKGLIDDALRKKLDECCQKACSHAKNSHVYSNPSSSVYILVDELDNIKKSK